jgi:predicted RNA-binding protein associated with RNAse of E/G family
VPPPEGSLRPPTGQPVTVIKSHPHGHRLVEYPAIVIDIALPGDWVAVLAQWTMRRVESSGLAFEPGDHLVEIFSPTQWFNVFHVFDPSETPRGWYANVTAPAVFTTTGTGAEIDWRDLYLDLICPAQSQSVVTDQHELEASGLAGSDPALYDRIVSTMKTMQDMAAAAQFPFVWPPS